MNEKGFMYPVTLCIFLLTSLFLTIEFSQYTTQKRVITEINQQERRQYLFLLTSKNISDQIAKGEIPDNGLVTYHDITITYSISQSSNQQYDVTFTMQQGILQVKAEAQYEGGSGKLIKWLIPV